MTDRAALKKAVQERIMALEEQELETAVAHYEAFMKESQLGGREVHDKDDMVGARENADLAAAFDHPVQTHHAKIDVLEGLDFGLKDAVEPGAVVVFKDRRFVVAVSTARFDVQGRTYMGISTQSPIFKAMKGLEAGDVFTMNGQDLEIQEVF